MFEFSHLRHISLRYATVTDFVIQLFLFLRRDSVLFVKELNNAPKVHIQASIQIHALS